MRQTEGEKTKWYGLWQNREGVYSGEVLAKREIPPYTRIVLRYNRFYERGKNKPRFVYCFASGDKAKAITVEKDEREETRYYLTDDMLQDIIYRVTEDTTRGFTDNIVSDYVEGYGNFTTLK